MANGGKTDDRGRSPLQIAKRRGDHLWSPVLCYILIIFNLIEHK